MTNYREKLSQISKAILDKAIYPGQLHEACNQLKELLLEFTHANSNLIPNDTSTIPISLNTQWAIKSIEDIYRTHEFCNGIKAAVLDKLEQHPEKTINLLYASTGPFATLILPLLSELKSDRLKITLVEKNLESTAILKKLINALEFDPFIETINNCDPLEYSIDSPQAFDLVLIDSLQVGLKDDPQVATSFKLMSQLNDQALLLPQEVVLSAYLVSHQARQQYKMQTAEVDSYYQDLGEVFVLNKASISEHSQLFEREYPDVAFPEKTIEFARGAQREFDAVMLNTHIKVYKEHVLQIDQSGLTVLLTVLSFADSMLRFKGLKAQYYCDVNPGIDFSAIN